MATRNRKKATKRKARSKAPKQRKGGAKKKRRKRLVKRKQRKSVRRKVAKKARVVKKARKKASEAKRPVPADDDALVDVRLNKWLADRGVASRRACDELITDGRIGVNGKIVTTLGVRIDPACDEVEVDGVKIADVRKVYYVLNKPKGVTCNNVRDGDKPRAIDFFSRVKERLFCVGRLDEDSEGLILLTNDGEFSQLIAHPRHQVSKTYFLKVRGAISHEGLERVTRGVHLAEGKTGGARIRVHKKTQMATSLLVTIREGKNRELRRVFAQVGHPVRELKRIKIGPLTLGRLRRGTYRPLKRPEVDALIEMALDVGRSDTREAPKRARKRVKKTGRRGV